MRQVIAICAVATWLIGCDLAVELDPRAAATREPAPAAVESMLVWLEEHTLRCEGPTDGPAGRAWSCVQDQAEGIEHPVEFTVYQVVVTAIGPALSAIDATVDQTADDDADVDRTRGFLADTIGLSPPTGAAGPALEDWVLDTLDTGGQATFGPISATLAPNGPVTRLRLEFELLQGSRSG